MRCFSIFCRSLPLCLLWVFLSSRCICKACWDLVPMPGVRSCSLALRYLRLG